MVFEDTWYGDQTVAHVYKVAVESGGRDSLRS